MITAILNTIGPFIFWMLQKWIEAQENKKVMLENYYSFLDAVDKSGQVKVANHLSATQSLKEEQLRLQKELEEQNAKS